MSKPIKNLIKKVYQKRFGSLEGAVLIDIRGMNAHANNTLRAGLAQKAIRITVVTNNLAAAALQGTRLERIGELLDGPTAVVYGGESVVHVARELIQVAKQLDKLEFKGALMEGVIFGPGDVDKLSKYPTREEALGQVVQVVLGPAGQLVGAVTGPGGAIASILQTIADKLEKGETIQKVA
jgi:large subunit ribosomal protein L10